ncbi:MAG: sugar phosphate isomerase/epimerase [Candidatus Accumulibacter sp.]|jgi:xylose isomerase|nr:sugar phosphate isomerase/epimerase [Accumulibacter sp.]
MKQSVIIGFLGKTQDRFCEYHTAKSTYEKLQMVRRIKGFDGVEMVFPHETSTPEETTAMMRELELNWAAINVNVKKDPQFVAGSLSRPIRQIREEAVALIKGAKDFAKAVGAPLVTCCPLSDGYDTLFQVDYQAAWKYMVETIGEAADYLPEVPLFLEPKYSEVRVHCHLDNTSKALLLLKEIGSKNTGITLDIGHSILSQENPAQMFATVKETGFDVYIHTNDNDARADWDLIGGSRHFLNYVELLFWAKEYGYEKYFTTDASPRTCDIVDFFERHAEVSLGIWNLVNTLDAARYRRLMREENHNELISLVTKEIYRV